MKKITVPDAITFIRIIGAAVLLFLKFNSLVFLTVYTVCGISDVIDGTVARATGTQSEGGARLDSIADLIFYSVMLIKAIPSLFGNVDNSVWIFACAVLLVRISSYIVAAIKYRCFSSVHTYLNKLTGFAVFILPYLLYVTKNHTPVCLTVCAIGITASAEEFAIHIVSSEYTQANKTLISAIKNRQPH